jgi:hypothetical protein
VFSHAPDSGWRFPMVLSRIVSIKGGKRGVFEMIPCHIIIIAVGPVSGGGLYEFLWKIPRVALLAAPVGKYTFSLAGGPVRFAAGHF